jgi:hypothetical protein
MVLKLTARAVPRFCVKRHRRYFVTTVKPRSIVGSRPLECEWSPFNFRGPETGKIYHGREIIQFNTRFVEIRHYFKIIMTGL